MRNSELINYLQVDLHTYLDLLKLEKTPLLQDIFTHIEFGIQSIKGKEKFSTIDKHPSFPTAYFPLENSEYLEKCSINTWKIKDNYTSVFIAYIKGYSNVRIAIRIDNFGNNSESQTHSNIMKEIWKNYEGIL